MESLSGGLAFVEVPDSPREEGVAENSLGIGVILNCLCTIISYQPYLDKVLVHIYFYRDFCP